ncbi:peptidyl-tRNA hydrolase 2, mitochondrial-like isoform X2 [Ostrea edulis]|uniref:peptidyl-tRNA hydrolase 2, mitochondrial-like isoform X2 n=1 Tax=Ostrea edulis TaxID=37623 RepID=UPI002095E6A7|nr:peptidyl-tRNA hydrolase 2, mitochondrial-like isoform X2 [Ostrea edulis]
MDRKEVGVAVSIGVGLGFVLGWLMRGRSLKRIPYSASGAAGVKNSDVDLTDSGPKLSDNGEYKLVLVMRQDLKMGKGKMAAQCCHAAVHASEFLARNNPELFNKWKMNGQPKVVVKADSEQVLIDLSKKARSLGLNASLIRDAGRTQIAPGSKTVLGVGPGPENLVNEVTGHLKLC